jgi:hypothetical protein
MARRRMVAGDVVAEVDTSAAEAALRAVGARAAAAFVRSAQAELWDLAEPYRTRERWPVRTGQSADAFGTAVRERREAVGVALHNDARNRWGAYAYKVRWSVRTADSLLAEARAWGARGRTPESREKLERMRLRRLHRTHGQGAPSAQLAGRQPWRELRSPARKRAVAEAVADAVRIELGE